LLRSLCSLRADRAFGPAYFVVARRRKACRLSPPQHGAGRDPGVGSSARRATPASHHLEMVRRSR